MVNPNNVNEDELDYVLDVTQAIGRLWRKLDERVSRNAYLEPSKPSASAMRRAPRRSCASPIVGATLKTTNRARLSLSDHTGKRNTEQ